MNDANLHHFGKLKLSRDQLVHIEVSGTCMERWAICDNVMFYSILVCDHGHEAKDEELQEMSII